MKKYFLKRNSGQNNLGFLNKLNCLCQRKYIYKTTGSQIAVTLETPGRLV